MFEMKFTIDFIVVVKFHLSSTLLIDGSKNKIANTENVACLLHNAYSKAFFLEIFDLTDTKETVIELSNMVENYKSLALEKHGTHIYT